MSRRHIIARAAAVLAAATLLVAGCSSSSPTTTPGTTNNNISSVSVLGAAGAKPKLTLPTPFSVKQTGKVVLTKGSGSTVTAGERVIVDYTGFNGTDGKEFDSSFDKGKKSPSLILDPQQSLPGLVKGIVGSTVGSRLLLAIPPEDAYGVEGQTSVGIGPTDTILIVVDVKSAKAVLSRATGTAVAAKAGLPTVKLAANGKPTITVPGGAPPADLVVQPLITGTGPKVGKGQQITVHYTGVIWASGKKFDSSWDRGQPASFPIGQGQVVAGWDEGLVGQQIGSQVLLVIPPDKGYGASGQPDAGIKGTDTLVFVVDILDAS
ncbi:MAG TPA: FKBP-type peptidyl-prolyl cis-trans isomerase [Kineosporiaceae bacterium]|nr:FKBP-type peptidyl-prolyl cis-trans isomerase [Kineosporiaceae bacterium]